jgi:ion channel
VQVLTAVLGLAIIVIILWDAFETIVLPRRVTRKIRLARLFYRATWSLWAAIARRMSPGKRQQGYLSIYGPASLLALLVAWALGLIFGYALLLWSLDTRSLASNLYMSGTNFFTLGLGDITPTAPLPKFVTVMEAGTGLGLLAIVIGYLPVVYQSFSRRELIISLLDARAGSPASAGELLRRHAHAGGLQGLAPLLQDWERWCAELLESHISYPVLAYFRSQHNNQSWLAALTTILDTCAIIIQGFEGFPAWQAQLTFALARHAAVDLAQVFSAAPVPPEPERLPMAEFTRLESQLRKAGVPVRAETFSAPRLAELRATYEPFLNSLAVRLLLTLPPWMHLAGTVDNWRTSAWGRISSKTAILPIADDADEEHS